MSYTKSEEDTLRNASPVTYKGAVALSATMGKPLKSIIQKLQFMNLVYIKKAVPAPKPVQTTKAQLTASIEAATELNLSGLSGASRDALVALEAYLNPDLAV